MNPDAKIVARAKKLAALALDEAAPDRNPTPESESAWLEVLRLARTYNIPVTIGDAPRTRKPVPRPDWSSPSPIYHRAPIAHYAPAAQWHHIARMPSDAPCDLRCGRRIFRGEPAFQREGAPHIFIHDDPECW